MVAIKQGKVKKTQKTAQHLKQNQQPYGSLIPLNTSRLLLDSVGQEKLAILVKGYLKLLETSAAAYETNGDYAARIFASGWCQLLDNFSRNLCLTKDNKKAISCGKWLCHESCWKIANKAITTGKIIDEPSACGLQTYVVPIKVNHEVAGAIEFCYGDPPKDKKTLKKLAAKFKCNYENLQKVSANYKSRPSYVIEAAKRHLKASAQLIGLIIERKKGLNSLEERIKELELTVNLSNILRKNFYDSIVLLLKKIITIIPRAFRNPSDVCAQLVYNKKAFRTKNFKETTLCLKDEVDLGNQEKIKIEIFHLNTLSTKKSDVVFLNEEIAMIHGFIQLLAEVIMRKNSEEKLKESLERFESVFEGAPDGILIADPKTQKFVSANLTMCNIIGYSLDELLAMGISDIHPAKNLPYIRSQFKLQVAGKTSIAENMPILRKDGSIFFCDINAKITKIGRHKYLVGFFRDITHRLELENSLKIKARHIMALAQINQAMVYAVNEKELLQKVCEVVVNIGKYTAVWIGFIGNDSNKTIKLAASFAFPTKCLKKAKLTWGKKSADFKPIENAMRKAKIDYTNNLLIHSKDRANYHACVKKLDCHSLISLPLINNKEVYGILNIYAKSKNAFDKKEVLLLKEITTDLNYGITMLRLADSKKSADLVKEKISVQLRKSLEDTISIISASAEKKDPYTAGHQRRVTQLSVAIAKKMNLPDQIIEGIYFGGLIHDLGKMYVPAEILARPGKLTASEFAIVREHTKIGRDIVKDIDFIWPIEDVILHHHERLDGSGYPEKLKGNKISIECRIIGVADVVEAMSSHRPYRAALGIDAALNEIKKNKGKLYDPKIVNACISLFKEGFCFGKQ